MPDKITIVVETVCGEFDLYKLDYSIGEKQNNRCIVQVVNKTNASEAYVKQVLSMVIQEHFAKVLLAKLRSFKHTEQPDCRGEEGGEESESDVEWTESDED
jgi:hypothetical protein